jgi:alkylated DNA nucleotide flippase Atl1
MREKIFYFLTLVPRGKVVTYKQIAEYLGNRYLARYVGNMLHENTDGDKYPCYKVVNSQGDLAEAYVFGGIRVQKRRLEAEGIEVVGNRVDLEKYRWIYDR